MSHKTMIGSTSYEILGGKTLIGGTGYDMSGGRTLVSGTEYDIKFSINVEPIILYEPGLAASYTTGYVGNVAQYSQVQFTTKSMYLQGMAMVVPAMGINQQSQAYVCFGPYDLTHYSTLYFDVDNNGAMLKCGYTEKQYSGQQTDDIAFVEFATADSTTGNSHTVNELDISNANGTYYIVAKTNRINNSADSIYNLWLE